MRLELSERTITVVLSRHNLAALLAKLDGYPAQSAATIFYDTDGQRLFVKAEENDAHYAHPERDDAMRGVAGTMHPDTERRLGELGESGLSRVGGRMWKTFWFNIGRFCYWLGGLAYDRADKFQ